MVKQALKADTSPAGGPGAGETGLEHIAFKAHMSKMYSLENIRSWKQGSRKCSLWMDTKGVSEERLYKSITLKSLPCVTMNNANWNANCSGSMCCNSKPYPKPLTAKPPKA